MVFGCLPAAQLHVDHGREIPNGVHSWSAQFRRHSEIGEVCRRRGDCMDGRAGANQDSMGKKRERKDGGRVAKTPECGPYEFEECKVECHAQVVSEPFWC